MITARVFAVLSALFLVGAFALATTAEPNLELLIASVDQDMPSRLRTAIRGQSDWAWTEVVTPLMQRPGWLVPASLGIVCAGVALTASSRRGAPRSHRRRS